MIYLQLYTVVQAVALVVALAFLKGRGFGPWGIQRYYLIVVLATELAGVYLKFELQRSNLPVYNLFVPVEGAVVGWILYRFIQPVSPLPLRRVWLGWLALLSVGCGLEWALNPLPYLYFNYTVTLMSLVFTAACAYYLVRLMKVDPARGFRGNAKLWWIVGTGNFYAVGLATNILLDMFIAEPIQVGDHYLHSLLTIFANIIQYTLWTYAYSLRSRQTSC